MQQVLLNTATGKTSLIEAPVPSLQKGQVLIRTRCTLISAGTERMLVDFGRASMIDKARQQPDKVRMGIEMVRQLGAFDVDPSANDELVAQTMDFCRGRGVDAVIITASTESSEPVSQAAKMCRKRGKIVLVGVTGLKLSRQDFYQKEITFQVSCSYGPGRYDASYEQKGQDYPVAFVRWTEQRNFEAVLDLMASNALEVAPLITHRFCIESAEAAYSVLSSGGPSLGIVLQYPQAASKKETDSRTIVLDGSSSFSVAAKPVVG